MHIGEGREQAQVLRGGEPCEGEQRRDRDGDVRQMVLDHLQVLARGAVNHQHADADDEREHAGQRSVETERRAACGRRR